MMNWKLSLWKSKSVKNDDDEVCCDGDDERNQQYQHRLEIVWKRMRKQRLRVKIRSLAQDVVVYSRAEMQAPAPFPVSKLRAVVAAQLNEMTKKARCHQRQQKVVDPSKAVNERKEKKTQKQRKRTKKSFSLLD